MSWHFRLPDATQIPFAMSPSNRSRHGLVAWDIRGICASIKGAEVLERMVVGKTACAGWAATRGQLRAGRIFASPKVTVEKLVAGWADRTGAA